MAIVRYKPSDLKIELATIERSLGAGALKNYLPNPDPILIKSGLKETILDEIASNANVSAAMDSRKSKTLSKEWKLLQKEVPDAEMLIYDKMLGELDVYGIIEQVLNTPFYGRQIFEVNWSLLDKWIPTEIISKPLNWFIFMPDGVMKYITKENSKGIELPELKFIAARHRPSFSNPYGEALLMKCYWSFYIQNQMKKLWLVYAEKYGMPMIEAKFDPNDILELFNLDKGKEEEAAELLITMLNNAVQDSAIALPKSIETTLTQRSSQSDINTFRLLIKQSVDEISKVILGHTGAAETTSGRLGNEDTALEVRDDLTQQDQRLVEDVFNRVIKWVAAVNFNPEIYPVFQLYEEDDVELISKQAEVAKTLKETGITFTKKYYETHFNLKEDDFELTIAEPTKTLEQLELLEVAEKKSEVLESRKTLEEFTDMFIEPKLQTKLLNTMVQPVIDYVNGSKDYETMLSNVHKLFPDLPTAEFEETVEGLLRSAYIQGEDSIDVELDVELDKELNVKPE